MKSYDYSTDIIDTLLEKGVIDEELYEKCQPKHIASLPGNLRDSNVDELQHRLDVIDERMKDMDDYISNVVRVQEELESERDNLEEKNKILQKTIDDFEDIKKSVYKSDDELQKEALDTIKDINDKIDSVLDGVTDGDGVSLLQGVIDGKPNMFHLGRYGLNEMFEYSGLITHEEAQSIFDLSNTLRDYATSPNMIDSFNSKKEYDAWRTQVMGICKDIDYLANKHDVNVHEMGKELDSACDYQIENDVLQINDNLDRLKEVNADLEDYRKSEAYYQKVNSDYANEKKRTEDAINRKSR